MTSGTGLPGRALLPTRHPGDRASFTDPAPPAWFRARAGPNSNGAARMSGPMIDISDKCNPRLQPRSSRRLRHDHDEAEWEYAARAGTQTAISGATRSARRTPIVMGVAAGGMVSRPHRSAHSSLMRSASTIWSAMSSNGSKIATTTITMARRPTVRPGSKAATAKSVRPRRSLELFYRQPPLGVPRHKRHRLPDRQPWFPGGAHAFPWCWRDRNNAGCALSVQGRHRFYCIC